MGLSASTGYVEQDLVVAVLEDEDDDDDDDDDDGHGVVGGEKAKLIGKNPKVPMYKKKKRNRHRQLQERKMKLKRKMMNMNQSSGKNEVQGKVTASPEQRKLSKLVEKANKKALEDGYALNDEEKMILAAEIKGERRIAIKKRRNWKKAPKRSSYEEKDPLLFEILEELEIKPSKEKTPLQLILEILPYSGPNFVFFPRIDHFIMRILASENDKSIFLREIDVHKNSLLQLVCQQFGLDLAVFLIENMKVDLNHKNLDGRNALHIASISLIDCPDNCKDAAFQITEFLLRQGLSAAEPDELRCSPLHFAAEAGDSTIVALMLLYGGDPRLNDSQGKKPIDYALENQMLKCVSLLHHDSHWEEFQDRKTGRPFYVNSVTNEKTMDRPLAVTPSISSVYRQLVTESHESKNGKDAPNAIEGDIAFGEAQGDMMSPVEEEVVENEDEEEEEEEEKEEDEQREKENQKEEQIQKATSTTTAPLFDQCSSSSSSSINLFGKRITINKIRRASSASISTTNSPWGFTTNQRRRASTGSIPLERLNSKRMSFLRRGSSLLSQHTAALKGNVRDKMMKWREHAWREGIRKASKKRRRATMAALRDYQDHVKKRDIIDKEEINKLKTQLEAIVQTKEMTNDELKRLQDELNQEQKEKHLILDELAKTKFEIDRAKQEFEQAQKKAAEAHELVSKLGAMEVDLKAKHEENEKLKESYKAEQVLRRQTHNKHMDLLGAIRVYCRIRPLSEKERKYHEEKHIHDVAVKVGDGMKADCVLVPSKQKEFRFDACFGPSATQEQVFEQVEPLIQSTVDGYNVCIFAYGQTGSGKSFTMTGPADEKLQELHGIAPRSVYALFDLLERTADNFNVESYGVELYNGALRDLLSENVDAAGKSLNVKKDQNGCVFVENVKTEQANSAKELLELLRRMQSHRKVAATNMNAESSRSHLIFSILISYKNHSLGTTVKGKLTLVDLAGSEKVAQSGVTGQGLKEAVAINQSLSALGDVISALTENKKFIPYRNNLLTQLMADGLGGNAKTLMFVNVSPVHSSINESTSSLQYATRVKKIKNKSKKNEETDEMQKLKRQVKQLKMLALKHNLPLLEEGSEDI